MWGKAESAKAVQLLARSQSGSLNPACVGPKWALANLLRLKDEPKDSPVREFES